MTRGKERVMKDALNPFQIAQRQLDDAAQRLGLDPAMHELLRWPMQELKVILWYALF
jgi:glutamate dehydrogenase (NAD(P)+)